MKSAIDMALDRAVDVLDSDDGMSLVQVCREGDSPFRLEFVQKHITEDVLTGLGKALEFLKPECVVFVVNKRWEEYWVWAGDRIGRTATMKVPFEYREGIPVLELPTDVNMLGTKPVELFWSAARETEVLK